jgi:phosphate transport system protein
MSIRAKFEKEVEGIKLAVIRMCGKVKQAIENAIKALTTQTHSFARAVLDGDKEINKMEFEIEHRCFIIMLRQQPVASDFRIISAALQIASDLERIGDQACDISRVVLKFKEGEEYVKKLVHIPAMGATAVNMVNNCIDSYIKDDLDLARDTIMMDDILDTRFEELKKDLSAVIKKDSAKNTSQSLEFLLIGKHLEKIGDHAVNICAWVNFSNTGKKRFDNLLPDNLIELKESKQK